MPAVASFCLPVSLIHSVVQGGASRDSIVKWATP